MKRVQHELRKLCVLSLVLIVGHFGLFCGFWGHFRATLASFGVISGVWGSFRGLFCLLRSHFSQFWVHFGGLMAISVPFWLVFEPFRSNFGLF